MNQMLYNAFRSENVMAPFCFGVFSFLGWFLGWVADGELFQIAFLAPFLSPIVYLAVRATNRKWRLEYEVQRYLRRQRRHPLERWLVWGPSAFAVFVLLFLPLASRMLSPFAGHFPKHRVPVPWNAMRLWSPVSSKDYRVMRYLIPDSSYGMTPKRFFDEENPGFRAMVTFFSIKRKAGDTQQTGIGMNKVVQTPSGLAFGCIELQRSGGWMEAHCMASVNRNNWELSAFYRGDSEELAGFYRLLEGTTEVP